MIFEEDIPESPVERLEMMKGILISCATAGTKDNRSYTLLRRGFMSDPSTRERLPQFVRIYRDLDAFWPYIKEEADTYAKRRQIISVAFTPLMDYLEGYNNAPSDEIITETIRSFGMDSVNSIWAKALDRRSSDPEGAITAARSLLESVIKHILDDMRETYSDRDDLPKLYANVARALNLSPNQHAEEPIKAILGGAMTLVNGIGTLRNRLSDSHGRGRRLPARPSARHASLAINTAGSIAAFLVETYLEDQSHRKLHYTERDV